MFHATFSTLIIVLPGALVTPMQSIRGLFKKFVWIVSLGMFNAFVVIPVIWTIFPIYQAKKHTTCTIPLSSSEETDVVSSSVSERTGTTSLEMADSIIHIRFTKR